jgi:acyl carrier protein
MQEYQELVVKLCDMLKPFNKMGIDLNEETDLAADLGLDSLKVVELLLKIEDTFDISIPLNVLPHIRTIKDFVIQLQKLLSERS